MAFLGERSRKVKFGPGLRVGSSRGERTGRPWIFGFGPEGTQPGSSESGGFLRKPNLAWRRRLLGVEAERREDVSSEASALKGPCVLGRTGPEGPEGEGLARVRNRKGPGKELGLARALDPDQASDTTPRCGAPASESHDFGGAARFQRRLAARPARAPAQQVKRSLGAGDPKGREPREGNDFGRHFLGAFSRLEPVPTASHPAGPLASDSWPIQSVS